jgi:DNA-binding NarL/FixJ family response regulator
MPTIDGIELLKKIRKEDQEVFFVMITGHPAIDSAVNAIKEGAYYRGAQLRECRYPMLIFRITLSLMASRRRRS